MLLTNMAASSTRSLLNSPGGNTGGKVVLVSWSRMSQNEIESFQAATRRQQLALAKSRRLPDSALGGGAPVTGQASFATFLQRQGLPVLSRDTSRFGAVIDTLHSVEDHPGDHPRPRRQSVAGVGSGPVRSHALVPIFPGPQLGVVVLSF